MQVRLHPHAQSRLAERGATETEVVATATAGEQFPAKYGRTGFRRNFAFDAEWRGRLYATKQVEARMGAPHESGGHATLRRRRGASSRTGGRES